MATRRHAREWAVQLLFQLDMNPAPLAEVFAAFWADTDADAAMRTFAEGLVMGVAEHRPELDDRIRAHADHWALERMGGIDRNVLRLAVYEILHRDDIPAAVSINEAVDLAKYFSDSRSGRFVNGILDSIRKARGCPGSGEDG